MSAAHTPGPWKVHTNYTVPHGSYNMGRDVGPNQRAVCTVIGAFEHPTPGEEAEANARLIAAAPELLAALQDAVCWVCPEDQGAPEYLAKWRAITAKALGETEPTPAQAMHDKLKDQIANGQDI